MTSPRPSAFSRFCAAFVAAALVFQPLGAHAALTVLAEVPLQGVNQVKNNIMFTLDDSASMNDEYLPDYVAEGAIPYCRDAQQCGRTGGFRTAWVTADPPMVSSAFNAQYYDPAATYFPGKRYDGTDLPYESANPGTGTSVYVDGFAGYPGANSGGTKNLATGYPDTAWCNKQASSPPSATDLATAFGDGSICRLNGRAYDPYTQFLGASILWTAPGVSASFNYPNERDISTGAATGCANANEYCVFTHWPRPPPASTVLDRLYTVSGNPYYYTASKVQFCSNKDSNGFGVAPCQDFWDKTTYKYVRYGTDTTKAFDPQAFTRVDIKPTGFLVNGAPAANPSGRSYAAEMANFAKWYTFSRTRMLAMKTASGRAFSALSEDNARVGFHTLWENHSATAGFLNITPFDATNKPAWFNHLYAATPVGDTPLPDAVYRIGEYFSNRGSAAGLPNATDPLDAKTGQCQMNYHLLSTDGYWNVPLTAPAGVGNQDRSPVPALAHLPGKTDLTPGSQFPRPYYEGATASSNSLADLAMRYWINDLRTDIANNVQDKGLASISPWQHVVLYGLAIGARGSIDDDGLAAIKAGTGDWPQPTGTGGPDSIDDLRHAAVNSRGEYYSAKNSQELAENIVDALARFTGPDGTGTGIALAGAQITATKNYGYLTNYDSDWTGDVGKYALDPTTGALPADEFGNPKNKPVWSASDQLDKQVLGTGWLDNRRILTINDSTGAVVPFRDTGDLSAAQRTSLNKGWIDAGVDPAPTAQDVLHYLRGDKSNEGAGITSFRKRSHTLGDIVYSAAVPVGAPRQPYADTQPGYAAFKTVPRTPMVYVGANDGMLHGFIDSCPIPNPLDPDDPPCKPPANPADPGKEAWAYVPKALFSNEDPNGSGKPATDFQIGALSYHMNGSPLFSHKFYVNATPRIWDVDFANTKTKTPPDAAGSRWHTLLVGGLGAGGRAVYALDVTNPVALSETEADVATSGRVLWEKSFKDPGFENLGYVYDAPTIVKTKRYGWVALVVSGYNNKDGDGKLFVLNPTNGELLHTFSTGVGSDADPSGLSTIRAFTASRRDPYVLQAYGGDLKGNVWRFDLSDPDSWPTNGDLIAKLKDKNGKEQPITTGVRVEIDQNNNVDRYLFIGTGRLLGPDDIADASVYNSLYVIRDGTRTAAGPVPTTPYSRADLNKVDGTTVAGFSDAATGRGWYQDATDPAQKIGTDVYADVQTVVYAFSKPQPDTCLGDLLSTLYARDFATGASVLQPTGGDVVPSIDIGGVSGIRLIQSSSGDVRLQVTTTSVASSGDLKGQVFSFGVKLAGGPTLKHRVSWRLLNRD